VISIDIDVGVVRAAVQGSRRDPYKVRIKVKTMSPGDAEKLGRALGSQALFAAKLLANEMPQDIETVFEEVNLGLFPQLVSDLETECSCPDWSNPCKHVAAVYYLLGEEFDRDPFLIFKLRGLEREKLIGLIGSEHRRSEKNQGTAESPDESIEPADFRSEPISRDAAPFWQGADLPAEPGQDVLTPPVTAPLLRRLGNLPFWRSEQRFFEFCEPIYTTASREALKIFEGSPQGSITTGEERTSRMKRR
jgi:uncharacterized Zn finger protein